MSLLPRKSAGIPNLIHILILYQRSHNLVGSGSIALKSLQSLVTHIAHTVLPLGALGLQAAQNLFLTLVHNLQ